MTAQIVLVDDHPLILHSLKHVIEEELNYEVIETCSQFETAIEVIKSKQPSLCIIDLVLGGRSGLELIETLLDLKVQTKFLILSGRDEAAFAVRCIKAGASGYVPKGAAFEVLGEAIETILSDRIFFSSTISNRLASPEKEDGEHFSQRITNLSDRELEVFELIGQGMSTKEIAGKLHRAPKTIDTFRDRIKLKLGLSSAAELAAKAGQWYSTQV